MRGSWRLIEVWGIGIYVHWTFLLLAAWLLLSYVTAGTGVAEIFQGVALILAIFACVALHELGHALTAKRFGVRTRDITLLPIGGVARMERIPENPVQEFWIAIAGPAVNAVIAGVLFGVLSALGSIDQITTPTIVGGSFFVNLMLVNAALLLFNLVPAFPMDGGRVLRAILATQLPYVQATQIAASIGQSLAILFGILGFLTGQWTWMFIALFVYIGAQEEAQAVQLRTVFKGVPVRAAMITHFTTLTPDDSVQTAVDELIAGYQHDFPVVDDDHLVGMLTRQDVLKGLNAGDTHASVSRFMHHDCPIVCDTDMLDAIMTRVQEGGCPSVAVLHNGRLRGLLTAENIGEWMMVQSALGAGLSKRPTGTPLATSSGASQEHHSPCAS